MTFTLTGRKLALLVIAVLGILAAYLVGSSRAANAAPSAGGTPATSTPSLTTLPVTTTLATHPGSVTANGDTSGGITVTGTGKVTGTPDTLQISLAVTASAPSIDDALNQANRSAEAVQKSLADHGVAAKDMQTSSMSIQPNYTSKGAPDGYAVYEGITASIHDLSKAGSTLSAAVSAGGDSVRVDGVSVALDDTSALVSSARTKAVEDAKAKATQYAAAAGRTVGQVVSISESVQQSYPSPRFDVAAAATAGTAQSVPIQAGSQAVSVDVTVVYAFA